MEGLEVEILEGEGSIQTLKDICQFPRITPNIWTSSPPYTPCSSLQEPA